ncbi:hypothetical protein GCM10027290_32290 [Micromonospora sonneratiae]
MADYQVQTKTGDVHNGGTNANVFITFHGSDGASGPYELDTPGENNFEQGDLDAFTLHVDNAGALESIDIQMDDTGTASGWYLQWVRVTDPSNTQFCFPYGGWMGGGDGPTQVNLKPSDSGDCN